MGGRRPLARGAVRMLGHHGSAEGKAFRRLFDALATEFGPFTTLQAFEASRVAAAGVELMAATSALSAARRMRRIGKGRRPSAQQIERLARRHGLADGSYSQALERLKQLCATTKTRRAPVNGAELAAELARERTR